MSGQYATGRVIALHAAVIVLLFCLQFVLPEYHRGVLSRVFVLAVFAMGYNILFGYVGLLSLGHAMFFAAGMYGAGLTVYHLDWSAGAGLVTGIGAGAVLAVGVGLLALRTTGVAFMIVTLMFAQVAYLTSLYFTTWTRGEEGLVLRQEVRGLQIGNIWVDFSDPATRYMIALALFSAVLVMSAAIVRAPFGRVLAAIRENEDRMRMLGYDVFANKLAATVLSGTVCAAAGASYGLLFGYVGSSFASIHYSILPLLWVLLGGAATTLGPLLGTVFMFYVIDITSSYTSAYMLAVGGALILLVLFFPRGVLGTIRHRWVPWLP